MRTGTVSYKLEDLKKGVIIPIGFVGENDFTRVIFDAEEIYKKYPSASVSMKVQPPKGVIYPAAVTRDGNTVIWQVKEADVANRGGGELQLTFIDGETKIKTYIAKTDVKRSLAGNGPAPDPVQDFVDNANEKLADVEQALDDLAAMDNIAKTAQASDIGKALSPKTVEDGVVTEWEYITPGGGTEDYTDLDNKPSIAGVTLSGNKTLEDLGIAAADDLDNLADDVTDVKTAIQGKSDVKESTKTGVDFDISDQNGNVIVRFQDGHIKTKNFDSSNTDSSLIKDSEATEPDLDISDIYGNVVGRFINGGIVVKQFDGRKYTTFSKSGYYTLGQALTLNINRSFKKDDKIVLHIETGAPPYTNGGRVAYYAGETQITEITWRGAETYLEYKLTENVSSLSAVFQTNAFYESKAVSFEVSLLGDVPITPKVVTIKKDGTGDYATLKTCLAALGESANDVLNPVRIEIYPGVYDVLEDYTAEEMADIYYGEISINQYSQTSFVGPKLLNGVSLVGMGRPEDVVLTAWLDPAPTDDLSKRQRGQISTLNLQGSGSIENLTIIAQNMRYCVHDDFSAPLGKKCKRIVKNCVFRGYNIAYGPHVTYGAGMPQGGMDFLFEGCDFGEDAGVHTQDRLYNRPEIRLINCKGHAFGIGDNETVDPVTEYTTYRFEQCDFLAIRQVMKDTVPHVIVRGSGGSSPFYKFDPQTLYNTGEITIVPLDVLGTALTVGTCVEMFDNNETGPRFKAITALENFAGIVVYVDDDDNTYIQTRGHIRTDRLGLTTFNLGDYVGLDGTACDIVASASDAFGKIVYVDNDGEGYVRIGGNF